MSLIEPEIFEPDGEEHRDREHYRIGGKGEADWALRKLQRARRAIAENKALFDAEQERLKAWLADANRSLQFDVEYFESILRHWHESQIEADPEDAEAWKREKNKTIKLPAGDLSMAKNPPSLLVENETAFIEWATANQPEWVKVERTVTRKPIASVIKEAKAIDPETGEFAPGVRIDNGDLRWKAVTE
jgi:hypothetical protein